MDSKESVLIEAHRPCDSCGSSDARALYSDGHEYCFSCQTRFEGEGDYPVMSKPITTNVTPLKSTEGVVTSIPDRKISSNTCKKYNVRTVKNQEGVIIKHLTTILTVIT